MAEIITVLELVTRTAEFFARKGVPNPRLDAELLVAAALGCRRLDLFLKFDVAVPEPTLVILREQVARRAKREPLQYIMGQVEWGCLTLKTDRRALIPRPETEELWEKIIENFKAQGCAPSSILDLGTGSGALALAFKKSFPSARVVATDLSADALALARENAAALGLAVDFRAGSWLSPIASAETFELIVSNPPYLTSAETASAEPEVRAFEPSSALTAPDDGFADLATIITSAYEHLVAGGSLWLETGIAHAARIRELALRLAYASVEVYKDFQGRERFARLRR